MSYRYGGKTRPGTDVAGWLNGKDAPWWTNINQSGVDFSATVTVTADATPHVKGAWTQLIASTLDDSDYQNFIVATAQTGVNTATLIDFAVGASGSEIPIVENIAIGGVSANMYMPILAKIPAGSRISARIQSLVVSKTATVTAFLFDTGFYQTAPTSLDVLGTSTTTSVGTNITDTYSEIVASLSVSYAGFVVIPSLNTAAASSSAQNISVAVGASGSEIDVLIFNISYTSAEQGNIRPGQYTFMKGPFTAGARISAKTSSSVNNGAKSLCLIGIPFI